MIFYTCIQYSKIFLNIFEKIPTPGPDSRLFGRDSRHATPAGVEETGVFPGFPVPTPVPLKFPTPGPVPGPGNFILPVSSGDYNEFIWHCEKGEAIGNMSGK
jgi:hypothetical protein